MIKKHLKDKVVLALLIGSVLGLFAAFASSVELTNGLKNPEYHALCSINPVISCGSVLDSKQGFIFGFSNSYIGMIAFSIILGVVASLIAGAKFEKWFWKALCLGLVPGVVLMLWLMFQSIFVIKNLCIYCMITWVSMSTVFWYSVVKNLEIGNFGKSASVKKINSFVAKHHLDILCGWFLFVILLIIWKFWYYWKTLV